MSVDSEGVITARSGGTCTITAATVRGARREASITFSVRVPLSEITLAASGPDSLTVGQMTRLAITYNPNNTTDSRTITWSSDSPAVASVDANGWVTAKSAGVAVIRATAGEVSATYSIRVAAPAPAPLPLPTSFGLGVSSKRVLVGLSDESFTLTPQFSPSGTYSTVTYTIDNPSVIQLNTSTLRVTPLTAGTANITARTSNGLTATVIVRVDQVLGVQNLQMSGLLPAGNPKLQIGASVIDSIEGAPLVLHKARVLASQVPEDQWKEVRQEWPAATAGSPPAMRFSSSDPLNPSVVRYWCVDAPATSSSAEQSLIYSRNSNGARQDQFYVVRTYDGCYQFAPKDNPGVCIGVDSVVESASVDLMVRDSADIRTKWMFADYSTTASWGTVEFGLGLGGNWGWIKDTGGTKVKVWSGTDFTNQIAELSSKQKIIVWDSFNAGKRWIPVEVTGIPGVLGGYVEAGMVTRTDPNVVPVIAPPPPPLTGTLSAWPTPGFHTITSAYGWRNCPYHGREFHGGVDISGYGINGAAIVAAGAGTVAQAYYSSSYGNVIVIDHGAGVKTLYAHQQAGGFRVSVGDRVAAGQRIGTVGSTGNSTGPHLHFEVTVNGAKQSPLTYVQ